MTKYSEKLFDKRWIMKRNYIFKRDNYKCTACGSNELIEVHHQYYYGDYRNPWEYPNSCLITVCKKCHCDYHYHHETEIREPPGKKRKTKKKKQKKAKRKKRQLSIADQQLKRGLRVKPRKYVL